MSKAKGATHKKGLGWVHEQVVDDLKKRHEDGSPCDWCGRPMWLDPKKNYDYNWDPEAPKRGNGVLQGDHSKISRSESIRRGEPVLPPDRLLHAECNRQRGSGGNDHLAASKQQSISTGKLAMDWPWD